MPWGAVVGAVASGVVGSVMNDSGGHSGSSQSPQGAATVADPFASQRPQYMDALTKLMSGQFTPSDPSYKFRFDGGMQALDRSEAAKGFMGSGKAMYDAIDYGQGQASTEYGNQFARLARLAGADIGSPSSAAQALMGGWQHQQQGQDAFAGAIGNAVGKTNWGNVLGTSGDNSGGYTQPADYGFSGAGTPDMNATPMANGGSAFLG